VAKKAGQRLSIKISARKSIPTKMLMTFQLIVKKTSVGDIIPESRIIVETKIAIMLLREGKMKKNK